MTQQENEDIRIEFPEDYQNRFHIFYDLMQYTVKDVLLVSSLYDDFILEEDGGLSEEIYTVYSQLNLNTPPPRILRVSTGAQAIEAVKRRHFDLIITMRRLSDFDLISFSKKIREIEFEIPIVLLLTNYSEIPNLPSPDTLTDIDKIFVFNGDTDLFLAIVKLIEDMKNVQHDTKLGNTRVIIVIEDTIQYYSIFLSIIYKELLRQTHKSVEEGVNYSHKLLKRRGRPKILLAETYEEACDYYEKYKSNVLGIISDIAFPRKGTKDFSAGAALATHIQSENKYLPIMLQSSDPLNTKIAEKLGVKFVHKNSPDYLRKIRKFFSTSMLFGDFRFINLKGQVITRANSLSSFEKIIKTIPREVIEKHGSRNDFSNWLYARGEHQIAEKLAPHHASEFKDGDEIRDFILQTFKNRRREDQKSIITEFSEEQFTIESDFLKVGKGSLGGKGRGLAFIRSLLTREKTGEQFPDIDISVPETIVICTDLFDEFIESNNLFDVVFVDDVDVNLEKLFLSKPLPDHLNKVLELIVDNWQVPLAIRSSSILEDSQFQPFAGIYRTYMIPNNQPKREDRLKLLHDAVKLVYASTYSNLARVYVKSVGQRIEVEKMAVVIQKIVGNQHNDQHYPDFSGVAKSFNFYPISYQKSKDGVADLAIGLGEHIVSGGKSLSFSPKYPKMLPQVSNPEYALKSTQTEFFSLKMNSKEIDLLEGELSTLQKNNMDIAFDHGVLNWLAGRYDHQNNRINDTIGGQGPLVITFPFLLKYGRMPLAEIIELILKMGEESFGFSVEIEFAVNLDRESGHHNFKILQIRPLIISTEREDVFVNINKDESIIYSTKALGNGVFEGLEDIVYVKPDKFSNAFTFDIKEEISEINSKLAKEDREYTLIGPGRWGTRDPHLGIPVTWTDIHNARVMIEFGLEDFDIDPSQGMHFFVNITSTGRGYLTVPLDSENDFINWDMIKSMTVVEDKKYVTHVRIPKSYTIVINGKEGVGALIFQDGKKQSHNNFD
ncbi:MAG: hypothetical protein GPJ54_10370 [Candidatus Heimdallarchaeota archaeon]|nr:hypothetical protein [Candidatus Heimdallarchaeota archaeon]